MTESVATSDASLPAQVPAEALEICRTVGWELYRDRNYPQAEVVARGLVAVAPKEPYHHSLLAAVLQKQGRFAEAIEQVDEGLRQCPADEALTRLRPELVASADRVAQVFAKAAGKEGEAAGAGAVLIKASGTANPQLPDKKTLYTNMLKLVTTILEGQEELENQTARNKIRI